MSPSDLQPELALRERTLADDPSLIVAELCGLLRGRGWQTAKQLMRLRPGWSERTIRAIASQSGGKVVSGPGMPGYCLHTEVATDELRHAGRSLLGQGKSMMRRGIEFLRMANLRDLAQPKGNPSRN